MFESAAEVEALRRGHGARLPLLRATTNPTVVAVERKLAAVDGAEASLVFSSGMAAISTALLGLLQAGDEVVCCAAIYGGTYHVIAERAWRRFGITHAVRLARRVRGRRQRSSARRPGSLWFESPINPTLRCVDVRRGRGACRAAGVISVVDNTFASPVNQPVLAMGVDLSMQSATKYLNGHSDVTGGVLSGGA